MWETAVRVECCAVCADGGSADNRAVFAETVECVEDVALRDAGLVSDLPSRHLAGSAVDGLNDTALLLGPDPLDARHLDVGEANRHGVGPDEHGGRRRGVVGVANPSARCFGRVVLPDAREDGCGSVGIVADETATMGTFLARTAALWAAVTLSVVALCLRAFGSGVEVEFGEQVDDEVVTRVDTAVDESYFLITEVVP